MGPMQHRSQQASVARRRIPLPPPGFRLDAAFAGAVAALAGLARVNTASREDGAAGVEGAHRE